MKAERETFDRLLAHFLTRQDRRDLRRPYFLSARAGLFVKLDDTRANGFIPARTIGEKNFRCHEDRHALIGDRSGESHRLDGRVTVRLVEAAPVAGALRFELLSEGRVTGGSRRPGRAKARCGRGRSQGRRSHAHGQPQATRAKQATVDSTTLDMPPAA